MRSKRGWIALAAILVILFLFRPGVRQLRARIADSIGSALDRRVALETVRVHLLPRPGFDLEGLVIYDDPAFSNEPMVRAQDVSAAIRLRSLLRGRLEIATLSADEPSINLVRNAEGRWNLASLLERNAHIPAAPTGKPSSERRPAFPYLEASNARVNFKIRQEKKSYALTDADLALWQESENSWGARMKAQPVRTDFNLTDTGLVEINATWRRAADLSNTPLRVSIRWTNGQLGQLSKLLSGKDHGWRGGVSLSADLSGTPQALLIKSEIRVDDFHRYDIVESENVRLATSCSAHYSITNRALSELECESPVGKGELKVSGNVAPASGGRNYDLTLTATRVPVTSLLRVMRQAKKQLPEDLSATGLLDATFHAAANNASPAQLDGQGTVVNTRLSANGGKDEIAFGDVPLSLVGAHMLPTKGHKSAAKAPEQEPIEAHVKIGAFPLAMGAGTPAVASGWVSMAGYHLSLRGDGEIKNLFRLADTLGIGGSRPIAKGLAHVDLSMAGLWQGFAAPSVTGTAQLRLVRAEMHGVNVPIAIPAAVLTLTPDTVSLTKLAAQTGDTHWVGSVASPRHCPASDCIFQFDLTADQLSTKDLADWFGTSSTKRPWYRILTAREQAAASPLLEHRTRGVLRIGRLGLKKLSASQITTQVNVERGKIALTNLRGELLQGTHQGNWTIDMSRRPPLYEAAGSLRNISLPQLCGLMNDSWLTGVADGKFEAAGSGDNIADLLGHGSVTIQFAMRNGSLTHVQLPGETGAISVHRFAGELRLDKGVWELSGGRLESHDGIYSISGTVSAAKGLNLAMTRGDDEKWSLSGTLAKPRVERAARTQADAKVASKP